MVTKLVCWNQPRKFQNIVVHSGGMCDVDGNLPDYSDDDIEHDKVVEAVHVTDDQDSDYVDEWE